MGLHHSFQGDLRSVCLWCSAGHVPLVSLLLNYYAGLDLERRDQRGLTALMKAAVRTALNAWLPSSWQVHRAWTGIRGIQSLPQQTLSQMSQFQRGER